MQNLDIVTINNKQFILKNTFTALMEFERLTGKSESITESRFKASASDTLLYMHCLLKAANRLTFKMTFDEFISYLDEDPRPVHLYMDWARNRAAKPEEKDSRKQFNFSAKAN